MQINVNHGHPNFGTVWSLGMRKLAKQRKIDIKRCTKEK
jgi:hypothetical protein